MSKTSGKELSMNYSKLFLFLAAMMASGISFASKELEKTNLQQGCYIIEMPSFHAKCPLFGPVQKTSVTLFVRINALSKKIGSADFTYYPEGRHAQCGLVAKEVYLSFLKVNPDYQKLGLGSYLFKRFIAYAKKIFDCQIISWNASPLGDSTLSGFERLVAFYRNAGAIDIDKNKRNETTMQYPLASAQMLASLMPIVEPVPLSKKNKEMKLANGATYHASPSDALGIIANYMGENNE